MGNGEWGMGNGEWGMGNGEWGMGNGEGENPASFLHTAFEKNVGIDNCRLKKFIPRYKKLM